MKIKVKNGVIATIYALILGAIISVIVWGFLRLMNLLIEFIWVYLPEQLNFPFFTLTVCLLGGLIIGIWRKKMGDFPEEMEVVVAKIKKDGRYPYDHLLRKLISAFLPLMFGASVGPEAGLTGIIAGLCYWVSDKFKKLSSKLHDSTKIGLSATLGTIFNAPMFGFIMPFESNDGALKIPKLSKIVFYILAIVGAFLTFGLLREFFGQSGGLVELSGFKIETNEWISLLPLCVIGLVVGVVYFITNRMTKKMAKPLENKPIISCLIAGLSLGVVGSFLPLTMFSGEDQMKELIINWQEIGGWILVITGFLKLLMTNVCISFGLKGGHFYPAIFSGVCLGHGVGLLCGINPIFSACIVTTTLMAFIMRRPLAAVFLLLICFPLSSLPIMLLVGVIGSVMSKFCKKWSGIGDLNS